MDYQNHMDLKIHVMMTDEVQCKSCLKQIRNQAHDTDFSNISHVVFVKPPSSLYIYL